jgi:hypothetical protein
LIHKIVYDKSVSISCFWLHIVIFESQTALAAAG